jgi:large conductance mechanosensitive channel
MLSEFKKFILRGNVLDLAFAVVIGAAFGAIVSSFVNDIIMPIIGFLTAGISFTDFKIILSPAQMSGSEIIKPEVAVTYGHLIEVVLQFLIISLVIFLLVKAIGKLQRKKEEEEQEAPPAKAEDIILLEEIRDLLKNSPD